MTIAAMLLLSVGLGFANEYRAVRTADSLHSAVRCTAVALRDGAPAEVGVAVLVPGHVVRLGLGEVVPADLRLLGDRPAVPGDVRTGESVPVEKTSSPVPQGSALAEQTSCAFMGTVVQNGSGTGPSHPHP